ncbi:MAG: type II toxin-antitoxin system VapC family toxin [Bacteroidota bacterium]
MDKVNRFLLPYEIVPFDDKTAVCNSGIRAELEKTGVVIGPNDMIIAATVLAGAGILITNNEREFQRVSGLVIENWAQPR